MKRLAPLFVAFALVGCNSSKNTLQEPQTRVAKIESSKEPLQVQRFVPVGTDPAVALDTQTGTLCRTVLATPGAANKYVALPLCAGDSSTAVPVIFAWDKAIHDAPLEASCYLDKNLIPFYAIDSSSTMRVISGCIIHNRIDKEQPLVGATDYDAILLGPGRKTNRRTHVSLASSETLVPPHGQIEGGLGTNTNCAAHQQVADCLKSWLGNSEEVMLISKSGEAIAHITMNRHSDPLGIRK